MRVRPAIVVLLMILSSLVAVLAPTVIGIEKSVLSQMVDASSSRSSQRESVSHSQLSVEAARLFEEGKNYYGTDESKAERSLKQALGIYQSIRDRYGEIDVLMELARLKIYPSYDEAVKYYQHVMEILEILKDRDKEASVRAGISWRAFMHMDAGVRAEEESNYAEALELLHQALALCRRFVPEDRLTESSVLGNLGNVYSSLGQEQIAASFYQQALQGFRQANSKLGEAQSLGNLARVNENLKQYKIAISMHEQALNLFREFDGLDRAIGERNTLINIGSLYYQLKEYQTAIDFYRQAQETQVGNAISAFAIRESLGDAYFALSKYDTALAYYQEALAVWRERRMKEAEAGTLTRLGNFFEVKHQPETAVVFLKQAINIYEGVRANNRRLSKEQQEAYLKTIEHTYRKLAALLLSQGRVLEAQQVLELLKIQELRGYTRDARAGGETQGSPLTPIESPVAASYNELITTKNVISLGQQITECESTRPLCPEFDRLTTQYKEATSQFQEQADRLRKLSRSQDRDPAQLQQSELTLAAQKVILAQPKTILIYPLVLEDRLWLVWGAQAGQAVIFASEANTKVSREELSRTVVEFRSLLSNRGDLQRLKQVSQKLYGWLVEPIRAQIDANGIQNLVFSLDRSTRYIPMQALFDGKQYLVEKFSVSTILTAGMTDTSDRLSPNIQENLVLGLGLSDKTLDFAPLPNVKTEIDEIVRTADTQGIFPGLEFFNKDFTEATIQKHLLDHRILHIATHGKFVPGNPQNSFLVLGNGNRLRIPDIKSLRGLNNVHLVVLSACQTAEGGQDEEGLEVSGISFYFLTQGAKSVVGSLWLVNDASTSLLMQKFYQNLSTGKMTKTQAMQQAQIQFIRGQLTAKDAPRRAGVHPASDGADPPTASTVTDYTHPYYWSPFILIGNGL